jgi:hypothetical protein
MESTIKSSNENVVANCRERLEDFFASYCNAAMKERAMKALRFLSTSEEPMAGTPEGWAAGIVYAVANLDRQACGIPGLLNSDFIDFFGVSMETVRKRAARVADQISI